MSALPTQQIYLQQRWFSLLQNLSIDPGQSGEMLLQDLFKRYSEPHRHYHSLSHIEHCLLQAGQLQQQIEDYPALELAIWFHDVIYRSYRGGSELTSAEYAKAQLATLKLPPSRISKVARLIVLTQHPSQPNTDDEKLLLDIDLAVLAAPWPQYQDYLVKVRKEYRWVPDFIYRPQRKKLLNALLQAPGIFHSDYFLQRFQQQAQSNLQKELELLG